MVISLSHCPSLGTFYHPKGSNPQGPRSFSIEWDRNLSHQSMGLLFFEYEYKSLRIRVRLDIAKLNIKPPDRPRLATQPRNRYSTTLLFDFRVSTKWGWDVTPQMILVRDRIAVKAFLTNDDKISASIYSNPLLSKRRRYFAHSQTLTRAKNTVFESDP